MNFPDYSKYFAMTKTPLQGNLLMLIDSYSTNGKDCHYKLEQFAQCFNVSKMQIIRSLKELEAMGHIVKKRVPDVKGVRYCYESQIVKSQNVTVTNCEGNKTLPQRSQNVTSHITNKLTNINPQTSLCLDNTHTRVDDVVVEKVGVIPNTITPTAQNQNSLGGARTCGMSLAAVGLHVKQHPALVEQFCMVNRIAPQVFEELTKLIIVEWQLSGQTHTSDADARRHFLNLMRYKIRDYRQSHPDRVDDTQEMINSFRRLNSEIDRMEKPF